MAVVFPFGIVNTCVTAVIIVIILLDIIAYKLRQLHEANFGKNSEISSSSSSQQLLEANLGQISSNCRRFSLAEVRSATNNFDDTLIIGHGGFGKVYKGVIDNGTVTVAMKRLSSTSKQGAPQFWTEVQLLSKFQHSHIVSLIGYCSNHDEMILVYEYMARGSLADHLYKVHPNGNNTLSLSWVQRLKICIGAAQGLDYLHTGTGIRDRVIHRDLKSANILLDDSWVAKVSDFGLSKIGPANQSITHVSTNVKGTFGYLDPEYLMTRRLTRKTDVYSFGVVLLEVLSGRQASDLKLYEQWGVEGWAKECINKEEVDHIIDPSLNRQILLPNSLRAFVEIAYQCLHYRSKKRPTMAMVVASLESALALQERRDSSMFEEDFLNLGGTFDNQENSDDSLAQPEVIDGGNGEHQIEKTDNIALSGLFREMHAAGIGGAASGAVFGELLKLVTHVGKTTYYFRSKLNLIKQTLDSITESKINLDETGGDIAMFVYHLEAGKKLLLKCSKIQPWDLWGKHKYSVKLRNFRYRLLWFLQVDVQWKISRKL